MPIVTIKINDYDYRHMLRHIARQHPGKALVGVEAIIDHDGENLDGPYSPALAAHVLADVLDDDND